MVASFSRYFSFFASPLQFDPAFTFCKSRHVHPLIPGSHFIAMGCFQGLRWKTQPANISARFATCPLQHPANGREVEIEIDRRPKRVIDQSILVDQVEIKVMKNKEKVTMNTIPEALFFFLQRN